MKRSRKITTWTCDACDFEEDCTTEVQDPTYPLPTGWCNVEIWLSNDNPSHHGLKKMLCPGCCDALWDVINPPSPEEEPKCDA